MFETFTVIKKIKKKKEPIMFGSEKIKRQKVTKQTIKLFSKMRL